jgi:hypothetical protein
MESPGVFYSEKLQFETRNVFQTVGTGLPDGPAVQCNGIDSEWQIRTMFLLGCRGDYESPGGNILCYRPISSEIVTFYCRAATGRPYNGVWKSHIKL